MKEKYNVEIAGISLTFLSDEKEEFISRLASILDGRIMELVMTNKRCTKVEAALLCAIDYLNDKLKSDERIENLKKQVADSQREVELLEKENNALRRKA